MTGKEKAVGDFCRFASLKRVGPSHAGTGPASPVARGRVPRPDNCKSVARRDVRSPGVRVGSRSVVGTPFFIRLEKIDATFDQSFEVGTPSSSPPISPRRTRLGFSGV